jgi:hypothetical protein
VADDRRAVVDPAFDEPRLDRVRVLGRQVVVRREGVDRFPVPVGGVQRLREFVHRVPVECHHPSVSVRE